MSQALGMLETLGLTPAMVAIDAMSKAASVRVAQVELNDLCGVCVKVTGAVAEVQTALTAGRQVAEAMRGQPVSTVIPHVAKAAWAAIESPPEYNPLIQQAVVFAGDPPSPATTKVASTATPHAHPDTPLPMHSALPVALGFIETQGFTAVFDAIDTACKTANVEVVGKEKLGGGYVTVVIQGELSAVHAAIEAGQAKVDGLGKLIAAHVIARPSPAVLQLLPKV